ncbi:YnfA family protein [Hyphomicrobium methylovorum]|uniref:YnfA family protein n=1 Tax=Hyphomicrobium methylovorum TaxID=84 RepID=UPI0015E765F1|nr:YnfA family protein [Hyphomicrobium methylovorum]MBA2125033.1 YnfA family protein [Hyphomicrobium methylovorum]
MTSIFIFSLTAILEIAGCFAFWIWARENASGWWMLPGVACLIGFAYLLTQIDVSHAGRAYAAYGGIYVVASLAWLWGMEGARPDFWDSVGGAICVLGTLVILFGPRAVAS